MGSSKKRPHGVTASRHGMKKQKLSAQSAEIRSATQRQKTIRTLIHKKETKLHEKKANKRTALARIPYNRHMQYLTIGEGNFSFTRALVEHFRQQTEAANAGGQSAAAAAAAAKAEADADADADADAKAGGGDDADAKKKGGSKWKKEGAFDPSVHVPFLPPNTLFTNPTCRVVATCYDSWKELLFKYPDVTSHLSYLSLHNIPIYTGVDALHLETARRAGRRIGSAQIQAARRLEAERKVENDLARKARRQKEDADAEAGIDTVHPADAEDDEEEADAAAAAVDSGVDESSVALLAPSTSPLLFPPFVTRRALHNLQNAAEARLHGSQKKKLKERRGREQEELKESVLEGAAAAATATAGAGSSAVAAATPAPKAPTAASIRALHRAQQTSASLQALNTAPRTRFHRIIFQFPHTGCGLKDTEANNQLHRDFLTNFFRNIVATRLLYPSNRHGELHVTLKKGEPYRSWNIVSLAKRVPGLSFKTSFEFYPGLYRGYEHRRTRGFEERALDLATGAALGPNADISGSGSMTYVFVRDPTVMDQEEDAFDANWTAQFGVAREAEDVRQALLAECDKIYKAQKQKYGESVAEDEKAAAVTAAAAVQMQMDDQDEDELEDEAEAEAEEDDADAAAAQEGEDEAEKEQEEEEEAAPQSEEEDEAEAEAAAASTAPAAALSLAAQLRQHFQPRAAIVKPHKQNAPPQKRSGKKKK